MDIFSCDLPRGNRRRLALTVWSSAGQTGRAAGNASFAGLSGPLVSGIRLLWVGDGGRGQSYAAGEGDAAAPLCRRLELQQLGIICCILALR